jgi:hypothetical protein
MSPLVLLSLKVAAFADENHVFGKIQFSACRGLRWVCQNLVTLHRVFLTWPLGRSRGGCLIAISCQLERRRRGFLGWRVLTADQSSPSSISWPAQRKMRRRVCGVRVMRRVLFDSEECRAFAASCADQANCALGPSDRKVWIDLAQGWLDLAADIEAAEAGRAPSVRVH